MKYRILHNLIGFFLLCLLSTGVLAGETVTSTTAKTAAEAKAEKEISLEEETAELIKQIKDNTEEVKVKRKEFDQAKGEERMVLGTQALDINVKIRELLDDLLDNIETLKEDNIDTASYLSSGKKYARSQTRSLTEELRIIDELIQEDEQKREQAKANALFLLEQQISEGHKYFIKLIREYAKHIERLERFGLDASKQIEYLKTSLEELAKDSAAELKLNASDLSNARDSLKQAGKGQDADLQAELSAFEERETSLTSMLRITIGLMKNYDLETADYSLALIRSAGEVDGALLEKDVIASLTKQWISEGKDWLIDNTGSLLVKIITVVLILFAFHLLSRLTEILVRHGLTKSKWHISKLLQDFLQNMISKLVFFIGILFALSYLGVEIGHLLAGLGVAGFIIGFALQDTLSNFASGMMILIYRPYDVGDVIEAAGQTGLVKNMSLVSTTLHTFDNQTLIIPNNKIWGDIIRNVTSQDKRRVDLFFYLSHDSDIEKVESILNETVEAHELILKSPDADDPVIRLHQMDATCLTFIIRAWTLTADYWTVHWDLLRDIKLKFKEAGISQPISKHSIIGEADGQAKLTNNVSFDDGE